MHQLSTAYETLLGPEGRPGRPPYRIPRWPRKVRSVGSRGFLGCALVLVIAVPFAVWASDRPERPVRTLAPSCVRGALVDARRVCGLGIAGRAYRWNDEKMRRLARRRAARNLAGMLRSVVNSAMIVSTDARNTWVRSERYVQIDDAFVDEIERAADHELWFDLDGEGPFRASRRTTTVRV